MQKVVVIGGDATGMSCASKIKREHSDWKVTVLERGEYVSYAACGIPYYVSGIITDLQDLQILTAEQFRKKRDIDVRMGWEATEIDRDSQQVKARSVASVDEVVLNYDKLMIATGARAIAPSIEGINLSGVFTVRNLVDAEQMHKWILEEKPQSGVIIGGGYIGLEMAEALRAHGITLHLVEMLPQVLNPMDEPIVKEVMEELERHEVAVHLDTKVEAIGGKNGKVSGVRLANSDEMLSAEMVILGSGVTPNIELAEKSGLEIGQTGGIVVNERQQTSDPLVYAGGDCVEQKHLVTGGKTWVPLGPTANRHGRIAGMNISGERTTFPGVVGTAVMKVFDLTVARSGLMESQAKNEGFNIISSTIESRERAGYYPNPGHLKIHIIAEKTSGRLLGAEICGGDTAAKRIDPFAVALHNKMRLDEIAMLDLSYAPPYSPVLDPVGIAAQVAVSKLTLK